MNKHKILIGVIIITLLLLIGCDKLKDGEPNRFEITYFNTTGNLPPIYEVKDTKTATTYLVLGDEIVLDKHTTFEVDSIAGR